MNLELLGLMKKSRDEREKFFLQGAKLCYSAKSTGHSYTAEDLKSRLTELVDDREYYNPIDGKLTKPSKVFTELEIIDALFCTYDITALFGESIPDGLAEEIKTVLHRLHYSDRGIISWDGLGRLNDASNISNKPEMMERIFELKRGNPEYHDQLLHELFVMMLYTNRLRKLVPNFQLVYGSLNLQRPHKSIEDCVGICPCNTGQSVDYLLLEKLNGITMTEALKSCTLDEFLSWIIQLSLAIEMGVIHFGFTHNNLQTDNVIIRKLDSPVVIRYFHRNQLYLLTTSSLAVMTNFELAHVKHKYDGVVNPDEPGRSSFVVNQSEHFGPVGFSHLGIYHNETRPFYDIYKVVMWSLKIMEKHNNNGEIYNVFMHARKASKFFGFMYERALKKALATEDKLGFIYSVTISDVERSRSIGDFINTLLAEFPKFKRLRRGDQFIVNPRIGYLECNNFCLLDGRSKVVAEIHSHNLDGLKFLGAQGCLERHQGLKKRAEELARFVGLVCEVDVQIKKNGGLDKTKEAQRQAECKRFTEEALEAKKEFDDFKRLLDSAKVELWKLTFQDVENLRVRIDEMIRVNNLEVQVYQAQAGQLKSELELDILKPLRELLCQNQEAIKGKIVTLVGLLSTLNTFNIEFEVGQPMPSISIQSMSQL